MTHVFMHRCTYIATENSIECSDFKFQLKYLSKILGFMRKGCWLHLWFCILVEPWTMGRWGYNLKIIGKKKTQQWMMVYDVGRNQSCISQRKLQENTNKQLIFEEAISLPLAPHFLAEIKLRVNTRDLLLQAIHTPRRRGWRYFHHWVWSSLDAWMMLGCKKIRVLSRLLLRLVICCVFGGQIFCQLTHFTGFLHQAVHELLELIFGLAKT